GNSTRSAAEENRAAVVVVDSCVQGWGCADALCCKTKRFTADVTSPKGCSADDLRLWDRHSCGEDESQCFVLCILFFVQSAHCWSETKHKAQNPKVALLRQYLSEEFNRARIARFSQRADRLFPYELVWMRLSNLNEQRY